MTPEKRNSKFVPGVVIPSPAVKMLQGRTSNLGGTTVAGLYTDGMRLAMNLKRTWFK